MTATAAEISVRLCNTDVVISVCWPTGVAPLITARTSGLLLVTGAGWYAAYRICTRLLGNRFVSVLVDGSQCNQLSSAERRLLYHADSIREEIADEDEEKAAEQEEGDTVSECGWRSRVSTSRPSSEFSITRIRRSMRERGLFSIGSRRDSRSGVVRREGATGEHSVSSCSIDRPDPVVPQRRRLMSSGSSAIRGRSSSSRCSDASASLNIVWENTTQQWDDEFAPVLHPCASTDDLGSIFDDVMSLRSGISAVPSRMGDERRRQEEIDLSGIRCRFDQPGPSRASVVESSTEDEDIIRFHDVPCMRDSSYMYRSVVVAGSEMGDSDRQSTASRASSRIRANGLWNLASSSHFVRPSEGRSQMETSHDSGLAMMNSNSSKAASSSGKRSTIFDSVIDDADLSEDSDDDGASGCRHNLTTPRRQIQPLSSFSTASAISLEWDNGDDVTRHPEAAPMVHDIRRRSRACIGSWPPPYSRDLMVYAQQNFSPKSDQFKALSKVYNKRGINRVSRSKVSSCSDLRSLLVSSLYHQMPLHRSAAAEDAEVSGQRRRLSSF